MNLFVLRSSAEKHEGLNLSIIITIYQAGTEKKLTILHTNTANNVSSVSSVSALTTDPQQSKTEPQSNHQGQHPRNP